MKLQQLYWNETPHRCFPVKYAEFLRTPFLQNTPPVASSTVGTRWPHRMFEWELLQSKLMTTIKCFELVGIIYFPCVYIKNSFLSEMTSTMESGVSVMSDWAIAEFVCCLSCFDLIQLLAKFLHAFIGKVVVRDMIGKIIILIKCFS